MRQQNKFDAFAVEVICLAIKHYLDDFDDLFAAIDRLCDSSDPALRLE